MKHVLRGMDDHTSRRVATRKTPRGFRKTVGSELLPVESLGFESTHVHLQFPYFLILIFDFIAPKAYSFKRDHTASLRRLVGST